jgi:hypothetical protein
MSAHKFPLFSETVLLHFMDYRYFKHDFEEINHISRSHSSACYGKYFPLSRVFEDAFIRLKRQSLFTCPSK